MKRYIMIAAGALLVQCAMAQTIDRSKAPAPGPAPVLNIRNPVTYKLANGITVLVVEDHRLPKVTATYQTDSGPITEGSKAGMLDMLGGMMNEGTQKMPKAAFDEAVDKIGATVNVGWDYDYASALTRYFKDAFRLMGQAVQEPAFTQESFDKLKSQELTSLKSQSRNARAIAARVTQALAYGKNNPIGEFETEQSIQALTLQDIKDAYAKYVTPSRGYLTIIGDIKPAEAKMLAEEEFGKWSGPALTLPVLADAANPAKTEIDLINVPNAVQSEINVLNLVDLKMSDPDYFAALIANYILGGDAQSRLFMDLREKHGFTYGAYSQLSAGRFQQIFDASASVRNAKTDSAVTAFLYEINRMRTEEVSNEELANAKTLYAGSFARGLEDPSRTATFASNILINKLPADFYRTYLQRINAVTADDVLRVAKKYMDYNNLRIVIVGNQAQILDGLKKSGYTINFYDKYADPVTAAK